MAKDRLVIPVARYMIIHMNLWCAHSRDFTFLNCFHSFAHLKFIFSLLKRSPASLMAVKHFINLSKDFGWKENRYLKSLVFYVPFMKVLHEHFFTLLNVLASFEHAQPFYKQSSFQASFFEFASENENKRPYSWWELTGQFCVCFYIIFFLKH